jgi:hypothetical protein
MSVRSANYSSPKRLNGINTLTAMGDSNSYTGDDLKSSKVDMNALREAVTDLYLDVKIRSSDEIDKYDTIEFSRERDKLDLLSVSNIVEYIKASIEILMNMKLDESGRKIPENEYRPSSRPFFKKNDKPTEGTHKSYSSDYDPPKEYENVIQKLEADIRNHIRVEQQLKLHIETIHSKLDDLESRSKQFENRKLEQQTMMDFKLKELQGKLDFIIQNNLSFWSIQIYFDNLNFWLNYIDKLKQKDHKWEELGKTLKFDKALLQDKSVKYEILEQKFQEMENKHQSEKKFMQIEINRYRDDEQYKSNFTYVPQGDHSNTYTHRKLIGKDATKGTEAVFKPTSNSGTPISINYNSQKQFVSHNKVMSITGNSAVGANIVVPTGAQSTKKKGEIRKIKTEIQKNLLKGYILNKGDRDSNANMEFSTRTPDKTNPELSPYMMDLYKKRSSYEDNMQSKIRSSGKLLKFKEVRNSIDNHSGIVDTDRMINYHKKSKSQSSISGLRSMDHRASHSNIPTQEIQTEEIQIEPEHIDYKVSNKFIANKSVVPSHKRHLTDPKVAVITIPKSIYNTYHSKKKKASVNRRPDKRKKSMYTDEPISMRINKSKEKVDTELCYNTNRAKWISKKKFGSKIFATKDSGNVGQDSVKTLRSGDERRSTSSVGVYMTDRHPNPKTSYNRYVINQYASTISNSKTSLKAKGNSSMIQRQLKNRGIKNMY